MAYSVRIGVIPPTLGPCLVFAIELGVGKLTAQTGHFGLQRLDLEVIWRGEALESLKLRLVRIQLSLQPRHQRDRRPELNFRGGKVVGGAKAIQSLLSLRQFHSRGIQPTDGDGSFACGLLHA